MTFEDMVVAHSLLEGVDWDLLEALVDAQDGQESGMYADHLAGAKTLLKRLGYEFGVTEDAYLQVKSLLRT